MNSLASSEKAFGGNVTPYVTSSCGQTSKVMPDELSVYLMGSSWAGHRLSNGFARRMIISAPVLQADNEMRCSS